MNSTRQNSKNTQTFQKHNKLFIALLVITSILPWPHGGEVVWQYLIFCISIFSIMAVYFINDINYTRNSNTTKHQSTAFNNIKIPLILLGTWLLFQILQLIPLPINLVNSAEQSLSTKSWQTISIAPNVTLIEIIKHASYITIFILTLLLVNSKKRVLILANTLFISSAVIAIYSLVNHFTQGAFSIINSIPPWTAPWEKVAHGTFSYQNHYASFLTLTIPLGYGLIYANIKKNSNKKIGKGNTAKIIDLFMSVNGLYLLSLMIMIIAIFKTASRGGNAIFMISIGITFLCILFQQRKTNKAKIKQIGVWIISMLIIFILIIASGVTDSLTKRLDSQGFTPNGRDSMHKTALSIIQERPIVGTGAGTYPILQHKYKSPSLGTTAMSKRAHNDYLEMLTNQGLMGFSILATAIFLLYIRLLKGLNKKANRLYGLQVASFCSVTAILLHSLADFNFHLPVNAVYFYLILALGLRIRALNSNKKPSN